MGVGDEAGSVMTKPPFAWPIMDRGRSLAGETAALMFAASCTGAAWRSIRPAIRTTSAVAAKNWPLTIKLLLCAFAAVAAWIVEARAGSSGRSGVLAVTGLGTPRLMDERAPALQVAGHSIAGSGH